MGILIGFLGLLLTGAGVTALLHKSLAKALAAYGAVSFLSALMFALMKAYDAALSQFTLSGLLTLAVFLWVKKRLEGDGGGESK